MDSFKLFPEGHRILLPKLLRAEITVSRGNVEFFVDYLHFYTLFFELLSVNQGGLVID